MGTDIEAILSGDGDNQREALENFVQNASKTFMFPELNEGTKRKDIWRALCTMAMTSKDLGIIKYCFTAIRILSREKQSLSDLIDDDWLHLLKKYSGFNNGDITLSFDNANADICVETQKSLCNIVFNSNVVAKKCCEIGMLKCITERLKHYQNEDLPSEIKFFDAKLLFLLTALVPQVREEMKVHLDLLIRILEFILKEAADNHLRNKCLPPVFLSNAQIDTVSEVLKALFNITININDADAEIMVKCYSLVELLRNYLLISSNNLEKTWMLRNNVVNLLTNMPDETYTSLLITVEEPNRTPKNLVFEGKNMTAIYEILMFLKAKFNDEPKVSSQHEILSPVITVLVKGANSNRYIRKFLRNQILPPLKDVHTRPEQGTTLRNHFCRLLTTPITQLRDLVAELLFVLCKKSVARMIKYTGYGNAAGLFAQRGLLAGGKDQGEADYSSDSEDSETEEYADHKHGINPVIGCYEEPHASILENMSEEQKEYEAMKLVELMDSLMKCGAIKPCRVGEDGKPVPIEHVLELQEGLREQQIRNDD